MKIVYMGTPDFAAAPLEALIRAGHEISAVVTQPDKQKGRGREVQMSPVKTCALKHGIEVFQPVKIREAAATAQLSKYPADVFVVAAFGQILSEEILTMPRYGCLNIHASLLPAYRGAAPIQWAILEGEKESGVTIMQMDKGIDTGDMYCKRVVPIDEKETGDSLHDKLMAAGAELIVEALALLERGELVPQKQDERLASHTSKLTKAMGEMDWSRQALLLERQVRGLNSWPGAYTFWNGKQLKIWEADVVEEGIKAGGEIPGTVARVEKDFFDVVSGKGLLRIYQVQIEGKKRMPVKAFLLGYDLKRGTLLGNSKTGLQQ